MKNQGLVYTKCDLHVHTPSSHDYPNKSVTAISLVQSAISKGLNAIAITDHNTGAYNAPQCQDKHFLNFS